MKFDFSGLTFGNPWLLLLLFVIPALAYFKGQRGGVPAVIFSSTAPLRSLGRVAVSKTGNFLTSLLFSALALLIIALARPQLGKTISHVQASGIDIMLALDVSRSMLAEDFTIGGQRANRIEVVKQVTQKFIEGRPNDRIGIVAFAGRPYLVSPLTLDHDWLLQNLERVKIGLVEDGTAIGSAIASAGNRLKEKDAKSRIARASHRRRQQRGQGHARDRGRGRKGARHQALHHRRRHKRHRADVRCTISLGARFIGT